MSTETRRFHIANVLTGSTGLLLSPRGIEAVYDLLNWMTDDNLFTHQLPRALDECKPHLLEQHPQLADIDVPDFSAMPRDEVETAISTWVDEQASHLGEYLDVARVPANAHTRIDPLAELAMNYPNTKVIPVVIDEGGDPS